MPEGIGYGTKKKKKRKGFLPMAKDIVRRTRTGGGSLDKDIAAEERENFRGMLRTARTGRPAEPAPYRPGRTLREKGRNLMRTVGQFARGTPVERMAKSSPIRMAVEKANERTGRPTRGTAMAAEKPKPRMKRKKPMSATESARTAPKTFRQRFALRGREKWPKQAILGDRLDELKAMGLITDRDRQRFLNEESKRLLGR